MIIFYLINNISVAVLGCILGCKHMSIYIDQCTKTNLNIDTNIEMTPCSLNVMVTVPITALCKHPCQNDRERWGDAYT